MPDIRLSLLVSLPGLLKVLSLALTSVPVKVLSPGDIMVPCELGMLGDRPEETTDLEVSGPTIS